MQLAVISKTDSTVTEHITSDKQFLS